MMSPVAPADARKISISGVDVESRNSSFYKDPSARYGSQNTRLWINQVNNADARIAEAKRLLEEAQAEKERLLSVDGGSNPAS